MEGDELHIVLSAQGALLGHVSPLLRAVTVDFKQQESLLIFNFFYDGEITEKLYDLASCTCVEADPGVFPYTMNDEITTRLDYPQKIPIEGRLIYLRKEPTPTIYNQKSALLLANGSIPIIAILMLALLDALLGKVTPELRRVTIDVDKDTKQLYFYFFYDGEISEENLMLADSVIQKASATFLGYSINKAITRLDYPHRIPDVGTRCPYARYEESL